MSEPTKRQLDALAAQTQTIEQIAAARGIEPIRVGDFALDLTDDEADAFAAAIEAEAAQPAPLDVEVVQQIMHERNESSNFGLGCGHANGYMRGQDCGKDALLFAAEYDRLAAEAKP